MHISIAGALFLLLTSAADPQSGTRSDEQVLAGADTALGRLVQMHGEIRDISPALAGLYPVAVLEGDSLFIFDVDSAGTAYRFQRKTPVPFPMTKGIRASFPLSSYDNKPTCVVSSEVFGTKGGMATIFHEFVHCFQARTCENDLKLGLHVARAAVEAHDYSWEINRRFPYGDSAFVRAYAGFMLSLGEGNPGKVQRSADALRGILAPDDYEYMVWVEWKEGFARTIENRIRHRYALEPNTAGREQPYDRVAFYYGGEKYITYIAGRSGAGIPEIRALFAEMLAPPGGK
jgi:hypothetical protein